MVAHFNKFAVCAWQEATDDNQVELSPAGDLRPILTPDQIMASMLSDVSPRSSAFVILGAFFALFYHWLFNDRKTS